MDTAHKNPYKESVEKAYNDTKDSVQNTYKRATYHLGEWKPLLRGWIHAVTFPLSAALGLFLVTLGPTFSDRITISIFVFTAMQLFGISALYHRFNWSPKNKEVLRKLDHTNIMLIIAGTYTPLAWMLLPNNQGKLLLTIVWTSALAGAAFRILWTNAPRWLYTTCYVIVGCIALLFLPALWHANPLVTSLIIAGGVFYIAGAIVYGMKKPNINPDIFGFHELFHAFTVVGFGFHFAAVVLVVLEASHGTLNV
ncbi:MAG: hemolysin III family protein [Micrococcaceae bacterium]